MFTNSFITALTTALQDLFINGIIAWITDLLAGIFPAA
jgi:hypothetical protein